MHLLTRAADRGTAYDIVCCVTSARPFFEEVRFERRGVPTLAHSIDEFYAARHASVYRDMHVRAEYDAHTLALLEPYSPDVLLLDGYLFMITAPLLSAFASRVINLHFADLTLRSADGAALFPGIRAVRDALAAGCAETRTTVHLVGAKPEDGPPIVLSWPFPVSPMVRELSALNAADVFKAYVYAHQQWMMRTASGPLLAAALHLIAAGGVDMDGLARSRSAHAPWRLRRDGTLLPPDDLAQASVPRDIAHRAGRQATDVCRQSSIQP